MPREAFQLGIEHLRAMQKELGHPPKRSKIPALVEKLVHRSGLEGDLREHYFRLLAACALLGRETLYNNYNGKKSHNRKHS